MKHLILDINIVLDILKRCNYQVIDHMLERCGERADGESLVSFFRYRNSRLRSSRRPDKGRRPQKRSKRDIQTTGFVLLEDVSLLSCFGFEQHLAVQEDQDLEDAQIALATGVTNGEKNSLPL